jgi:hypothetical protein
MANPKPGPEIREFQEQARSPFQHPSERDRREAATKGFGRGLVVPEHDGRRAGDDRRPEHLARVREERTLRLPSTGVRRLLLVWLLSLEARTALRFGQGEGMDWKELLSAGHNNTEKPLPKRERCGMESIVFWEQKGHVVSLGDDRECDSLREEHG